MDTVATGWSDEAELAPVARHRELQRKLHDGGFAGIIFPREYGGPGPDRRPTSRSLNEEIARV